ncbi:DUF5753 domain-containing protein [Pseudonocardia humida]|uniref:Helix-turn-helix domain-containing protein n=1 Tax=Pseudonocardia humida TaxID=2800819 RepID=A0ABT0ZUQ7_9PSEU|nr:DUF5753 domain-containing protein [Pseudonocardia humida]MCO1654472.1 helix-turn-helix domain-containing protein [Pseudonocardia humida]
MRRRILGRELRRLRERAGFTLETAAPRLEWSVSKLGRIEGGRQSVDVHSVRSMMGLDQESDRWEEVLDLTREARAPGWWRAYGVGNNSYVDFEVEAVSVREYTVDFLPGLLQTTEYSRAMFLGSAVQRSPDQLADQIAVRTTRQRRLTSVADPITLDAVVNEDVLYRPVGVHVAMGSGFTILNYGGLGEPDLAYMEHSLGSLFIEKGREVRRATLSFDRLRSIALSPEQSLALIRRAAEQT